MHFVQCGTFEFSVSACVQRSWCVSRVRDKTHARVLARAATAPALAHNATTCPRSVGLSQRARSQTTGKKRKKDLKKTKKTANPAGNQDGSTEDASGERGGSSEQRRVSNTVQAMLRARPSSFDRGETQVSWQRCVTASGEGREGRRATEPKPPSAFHFTLKTIFWHRCFKWRVVMMWVLNYSSSIGLWIFAVQLFSNKTLFKVNCNYLLNYFPCLSI